MKRNILLLVMVMVLGVSFLSANHYGAIFGTYVKYKSSTEVYITSGSGRCNDTEWNHFTETTLNLYSVLPAGEDFIYIYVDYSAFSGTTPTFIGSLTEPAWSDSKSGWYNGNDRCIGAVWVNSSGDIVQFQNNSSLEYFSIGENIKQVLSGGNPNGDWQTVETTAYIPINATAVYVYANNSDSGDSVSTQVAAFENTTTNRLSEYDGGGGTAAVRDWISLERGWSRDLKWYGYDNDNNNFQILIQGFRIER